MESMTPSEWRNAAWETASALRKKSSEGTLPPRLIDRAIAMLLEAEPPGTGASQIKIGYEIAVARGRAAA
ncbi:MAG: hypothetical protein DI601_00305 [Azospirillum brasilense]|nr:MAG: hypothetical protein DI601_00305 [Azospirillum brasilense]